jgi:hypothetical protein
LDIALEKPLILKGKDYKLTVLRFICPLSSINPPFSLKGKTFKVAIKNNSASGYASETITSQVRSISDFVSIVNNLLSTAHNQLYNNGLQPYIYFQSENRLFYMIVPELYLSGPDDLQIYFNETLYYYVSGFPAMDVILNNEVYKQIMVYDIADDGFKYQPPVISANYGGRWTSPGYARKVAAEYRTDYKFNWLMSVIVTSTLPILQDFMPDVNEFGLQNSTLIYRPESEFKWIDIFNDTPIDRFSFNFMWMSSDQNVHQLYLNPGESVSLKLYFRSIH